MPVESARQIAENLRAENGARRVVLCGIGEPTLHPRLEEIVREFSGAASELCMTTNGSLMNGALFERLVESGVTEFNFSLNAMTAETHRRVMRLRNFDRVRANVDEVLDSYLHRFPRVSVHVSMVLCDLNQHEAVAFADYWRRRNVNNVWIHPLNNRAGLLSPDVKPVDTAPLKQRYAGDAKVIVALLPHGLEKERICKIAQDIDFISVDGNMRLCAMDYKRVTDFGDAKLLTVHDMHLAKVLAYIRGETEHICNGCDFNPSRRSAKVAAAAAL
jgi:molybdenum cofactor biosynthesis enzyme MoaA